MDGLFRGLEWLWFFGEASSPVNCLAVGRRGLAEGLFVQCVVASGSSPGGAGERRDPGVMTVLHWSSTHISMPS